MLQIFRGYLFAQAANRTHCYTWNISFTNHHQVFKMLARTRSKGEWQYRQMKDVTGIATDVKWTILIMFGIAETFVGWPSELNTLTITCIQWFFHTGPVTSKHRSYPRISCSRQFKRNVSLGRLIKCPLSREWCLICLFFLIDIA